MEKVTFQFNKNVTILLDCDYTFSAGTFYSLTGSTDVARHVCFSVIGGFVEPDEGCVRYYEEDIRDLSENTFQRNVTGIILEHPHSIAYLSAIENISIGLDVAGFKTRNKEKILSQLAEFGISSEMAKKKITTLSGIEQFKVALAREVLIGKSVLLVENPIPDIKEETCQEMITLLKSLAHDTGKCVILATDSKEIAKQADEIVILKNGKLI